MKKVILLFVDSLTSHTLTEALAHRSVPALHFLREHATYAGSAVTAYPTMTASVDSNLLTGTYPDRHGIPGLIWYDSEQRRLVNYLNGLLCVAVTGIRRSVYHCLYALNEQHLATDVETIFEALTKRGLTSASINTLVHRGPHRHRLKLPAGYQWLTGALHHDELIVSGPEQLVLGRLTEAGRNEWLPRSLSRFWQAYGVNDSYGIEAFSRMIGQRKQADFTLLYLPDHDHAMHRKNPAHMRDAILQLDRHLQRLLSAYGDWQRALSLNQFILLSDHGQMQIAKQKIGQIDLDQLLKPFRVMPIWRRADSRDELAVANNERMAYVYPFSAAVMERVLPVLCSEARLDIVAWRDEQRADGAWVTVCQPGSGRRLSFAPGEHESVSTGDEVLHVDVYGTRWRLEGDWRVLDLAAQDGRLVYGDYPDALARLRGVLFARPERVIVVNARPRYEIHTATYPRHKNGGAHGSLHRAESEVPFWLIGADDVSFIPEHPRMIDIKNMVLRLLER